VRIRVIPSLLLSDGGLVKTVKFKSPKYVGDPINAVKIFNEKEVDELVFLDIQATAQKRGPNMSLIREIATECFMPLAYGGGITTVAQVKEILHAGVEKVVINSALAGNPNLLREAANLFGSQSIVASMDVGKNFFGKFQVCTHNGRKQVSSDPVAYAKSMEAAGAGEIFLNAIHQDGTFEGYDLNLVRQVTSAVGVPVIVCGGASKVQDFADAVKAGASAVAAGSMFVFHGPHRAVLINFPTQESLKTQLYNLR
jgi:cyclase